MSSMSEVRPRRGSRIRELMNERERAAAADAASSRTPGLHTSARMSRRAPEFMSAEDLPSDLQKEVLSKLTSDDWKTVVDAISAIQRTATLDPERLLAELGPIVKHLLAHSCSLRSSLARGALACLAELFTLPVMAPRLGQAAMLDNILDVLVRKASLGNRFLQSNADQAVTNATNMAEGGAVRVLCSLAHLGHWKDKDKAIRQTTAVAMHTAMTSVAENPSLVAAEGIINPLGHKLCKAVPDIAKAIIYLWDDQNGGSRLAVRQMARQLTQILADDAFGAQAAAYCDAGDLGTVAKLNKLLSSQGLPTWNMQPGGSGSAQHHRAGSNTSLLVSAPSVASSSAATPASGSSLRAKPHVFAPTPAAPSVAPSSATPAAAVMTAPLARAFSEPQMPFMGAHTFALVTAPHLTEAMMSTVPMALPVPEDELDGLLLDEDHLVLIPEVEAAPPVLSVPAMASEEEEEKEPLLAIGPDDDTDEDDSGVVPMATLVRRTPEEEEVERYRQEQEQESLLEREKQHLLQQHQLVESNERRDRMDQMEARHPDTAAATVEQLQPQEQQRQVQQPSQMACSTSHLDGNVLEHHQSPPHQEEDTSTDSIGNAVVKRLNFTNPVDDDDDDDDVVVINVDNRHGPHSGRVNSVSTASVAAAAAASLAVDGHDFECEPTARLQDQFGSPVVVIRSRGYDDNLSDPDDLEDGGEGVFLKPHELLKAGVQDDDDEEESEQNQRNAQRISQKRSNAATTADSNCSTPMRSGTSAQAPSTTMKQAITGARELLNITAIDLADVPDHSLLINESAFLHDTSFSGMAAAAAASQSVGDDGSVVCSSSSLRRRKPLTNSTQQPLQAQQQQPQRLPKRLSQKQSQSQQAARSAGKEDKLAFSSDNENLERLANLLDQEEDLIQKAQQEASEHGTGLSINSTLFRRMVEAQMNFEKTSLRFLGESNAQLQQLADQLSLAPLQL